MSDLVKQSLGEDTPELLAGGDGGFSYDKVSPDGKWVISFLEPKPGGPFAPKRLMRIPISGGLPELIFGARPGSNISCARLPANLCVISEPSEDGKQRIVTAFDPVAGRGPQLGRFDLDPHDDNEFWEFSPDGTNLAVKQLPNGPIRILS